jgi:hypothetical protein
MDELGKVSSEQEMTAHEGFGKSNYMIGFESWNAALGEAGFDPNPYREHRSIEELIEELQRWVDEIGRPPTSREMDIN